MIYDYIKRVSVAKTLGETTSYRDPRPGRPSKFEERGRKGKLKEDSRKSEMKGK